MATLDYGSVVYADPLFEPDTLRFAGTATYAAGTLLGRITASGYLTPFDPASELGPENPVAVLTYAVSNTGAGEVKARVLIGGVVIKERLVVHGAGDLDDLTPAVLDQIRAAGVTVVSVADLAVV